MAITAARKWIWVLLAPAAIAAYTVWQLAFAPPLGFSFERGIAVSDDAVLLVGRSKLAIVSTDGTVIAQADGARFVGLAGETAWFDDANRKLHARRVSDLELYPGTTQALAAHPVLSHRYQVSAFTEEVVFVRGPNNKTYAMTRDGAIEPADVPGDAYRPGQMFHLSAAEQAALKEASARAEAIDALPRPIVVTSDAGPATLADPDSVLVRTFDHTDSAQGLHRVGADGELLWSSSPHRLIDEGSNAPSVTFLWVGLLDGEPWAIVELSEFHRTDEGEDWSTHAQHIVHIDPETGAPRQAHALTF